MSGPNASARPDPARDHGGVDADHARPAGRPRQTPTWIGTAGNPVPRYVAFDAVNSGYAQPPTDVPAFINQRYPGVTYQTIFHSDGVYVFRRTANGDGPR